MLEHFARYPNDHIVPHLMTWAQRDRYYILYDKAKCSLRGFINDTERPELSKPVVIWFLSQLKGLAEAIQHVHWFTKPTITDPDPDPVVADMWGRHNDIKPENILVYETEGHQNPIFKITDFGQGILKEATAKQVSEKDPKAVGTRAYWAPESDVGISRPADMWALGCVFLELLLWLFGFYYDGNRCGFSTEREEFPGYNPRNRDDMYWYKDLECSLPTPKLKPAVERVIKELAAEHCTKMRAFERVIQAIEQLLRIDHKKRMQSQQLVQFMSQVEQQAKSDLVLNEYYYLRKYRENRGGTEAGDPPQREGLNPEASASSMSRSHSLSSQNGLSSSPHDGPPVTSAPSDLMQTGSAVLDSSDVGPQFHPSDGHGEDDKLRKELDDL
jgi:serine/threonine protein kinase